MRELQLYVPRRSPPDWNDHLAAGECAVFLADVRNESELTADGLPKTSPSSCLVFESEAAARQWSQKRVAEIEHLKCELYDRRGMAPGPIVTFVNPKYVTRLPHRRTAKWFFAGAIGCVIASLPLFWVDWRSGGAMVVPTFFGISFLLTAVRLLFWGLNIRIQAREIERQQKLE